MPPAIDTRRHSWSCVGLSLILCFLAASYSVDFFLIGSGTRPKLDFFMPHGTSVSAYYESINLLNQSIASQSYIYLFSSVQLLDSCFILIIYKLIDSVLQSQLCKANCQEGHQIKYIKYLAFQQLSKTNSPLSSPKS